MSKHYLTIYSGLLLLGLSVISVFNYMKDPYGLFMDLDSPGKHNRSSTLLHTLRITKPYHVSTLKPEVIVTGASRTGRIAPRHPDWRGLHTYNLSLPGGTIYETQRLIEHAHATSPLKSIVLGLDFHSFLGNKTSSRRGFSEARLKISTEGSSTRNYWSTLMSDYMSALISSSALTDSISTIGANTADISYAVDGSWDYSRHNVSHRQLFESKAFKIMRRNKNREKAPKSFYNAYRNILTLAYQEKIDTRIFIPPMHSYLAEVFRLIGWRDEYEQWKRQLVLINEQEAGNAGQPPFPLWDFDGYNLISAEKIPAPGQSKKKMRWNWEGSHFKSPAGKLLLNRMLTSDSKAETGGVRLGTAINSGNIDQHLRNMRHQHQRYRRENSGEMRKLAAKAHQMGYDHSPSQTGKP